MILRGATLTPEGRGAFPSPQPWVGHRDAAAVTPSAAGLQGLCSRRLSTLAGLFQEQCCEITLSFPPPGYHSSNVPAAKGESPCVTAAFCSVSLCCTNCRGKVADFLGMVTTHFLTLPITREQQGHLLFSEVLQSCSLERGPENKKECDSSQA